MSSVDEKVSLKRRRRRAKKSADEATTVPEQKPVRHTSERKVLDEFPQIESLEYGECLGFGHFSHVYQGMYQKKHPVAIKIIERGSERLVEKEVRLLNDLKGCKHIVQLYEVIHAESTLLVFELLNGIAPEKFMEELTVEKFRFVIRCLLEALKEAHAKEIVHRDLKLGNILIACDWSDVKLLDWGCGAYVKDELSPKAGSRTVRSPEMLMGYWGYGKKCDIWALGTFIFYVLCNEELPWKAKTALETITLMSRYIGYKTVLDMADKYKCEIPDDVVQAMEKERPEDLKEAFSRKMKHLRDPQLIELMHWLLTPDPELRPTAEEALQHTFFRQK